jgi:hypothetical protein
LIPTDYKTSLCNDISASKSPTTDEVTQFLTNESRHPNISSHTCSYCNQICLDLRIRTDREPPKQVYQDVIKFDGIALSEGGCAFLQTICPSDRKHYTLDPSESVEQSSKYGSLTGGIFTLAYSVSHEDEKRVEVGFKYGWWSENTQRPPSFTLKLDQYLYVYMHPENLPGSGHTSSQHLLSFKLPPNLAPNSILSYSRAQAWLRDCTENHSECKSPHRYTRFMPKRILELNKGLDKPLIRLVTDPPIAAYTALSYCWGQDQPAKTMKHLLESYKHGIMFQSLPRTIQDAVLVTLGLGIKYLWADAMCIIQDDDVDKSTQISQMHAVYQCSIITIAASLASSCIEGFLQDRVGYRPFRVSARLSDNTFQDVLLAQCYPDGHQFERLLPLYNRAWTFQEIHLSRRILSYNHGGMHFSCLQGDKFDGQSENDAAYPMRPGPKGFFNTAGHPNAWNLILVEFTRREMTVAMDKLPALAAMAQDYAYRYPVTDYYAGIWKENILHQLLWSSPSMSGFPCGRISEYVAPSWSWACLDGRANINAPYRPQEEVWPDMLDALGARLNNEWLSCCTFLSAETTLKDGQNPFGMVTSGSIRLSAKVRPIVCQYDKSNSTLPRNPGLGREAHMTEAECLERWPEDEGGDPRIFIVPDVDEEIADGTSLWCVEICRYFMKESVRVRNPHKGRSTGLVLKRVGRNRYSRVGLLRLSLQDIYGWMFEDGLEREEITIV